MDVHDVRRGSNRMWPVRAARYATVTLLVVTLTASITGVGAAAAAPRAPEFSTATQDPTTSEQETLERLFGAIEAVPANLQDRTTADPEARDAIVRNFQASGGTVESTQSALGQSFIGDPARCAQAVVTFLTENVVPIGKFIRLIREAGGVKKFAQYVYEYVRFNIDPAGASKELRDLIVSLTGVPAVLSACA